MLADRRRLILIVLVVLLLLCLVGAVAVNVFNRGGGDVAQEPAATATTVQDEVPTPEPAAAEPTATLVVEQPTATPQPSPTPEPTATEAVESSMAATPADGEDDEDAAPAEADGSDATQPPAAGGDQSPTTVTVEMVEVTTVDEILKNGNFEAGFAENGVGLNWQSFATVGAAVNFSAESADPFLKDGQFAQRISIDQAFEPDQYGGIQQTVEVIAGETYTLTVHGQIRSSFGSVDASNFGYRVQAALGQNGVSDWRSIDPANWIELPWPEQALDAAAPEFSEYTHPFVAAGDSVTLFVRGWNKWPDGSLGEYTFDALSIVGPVPGSVQMVEVTTTTGGEMAAASTPATEEEMVDKGLPVTGSGDGANIMQDGRFWGAVIVLLMLVAGAVYRSGWRW